MLYTSNFNFQFELDSNWERIDPVSKTFPEIIQEYKHKKGNMPFYITYSGVVPIPGISMFFTFARNKLHEEKFITTSEQILEFKNKYRNFTILEVITLNPKTKVNELHYYFEFESAFHYCGAIKFNKLSPADAPKYQKIVYSILKNWRDR